MYRINCIMKSKDGLHGIRTQGRRMQCVEEITGLWAVAPIGVLFLPNPSYLPRPNFGCPLSILINENNYCLVFCVVKRLACPFRVTAVEATLIQPIRSKQRGAEKNDFRGTSQKRSKKSAWSD